MEQKTLEAFTKDRLPNINWKSAKAVIDLVAEGATVPFIARYRKEKTGNLDEVQIRNIIEANDEYQELIKRKDFVLKEIAEQGNLSPELKKRIINCWSLDEVEELYRPFKKKKKTKATLARDAGIGPLADWIWQLGQEPAPAGTPTLEVKAKEFINPTLKYTTYEEVLRGAQHIIIEKTANDPDLREEVRTHYMQEGLIDSKPGKKVKAKSKYETYFAHSEKVTSLLEKKNSHRYLAMRRGWKEGELTVTLTSPSEEQILSRFENFACPDKSSIAKNFLEMAAKSALTLHVMPSVTNEIHKKLKDAADIFAIEVFAENVKKLLLASPYGARCVLGIDPGLRTGCKVALVDKRGQFISHTVLKTQGDKAEENAQALFSEVLKQIEIEAIAIGNGTGGREAEVFIRKVLKNLDKNIPVVLINEAGASVYSASDVARNEFPDLDITVRGAISIARRLQDPLAELVKIEPKSIGVGQYQHDVAQTTLKKRLDSVVEDCVNFVGVDVNTASEHLLQRVAGIGPGIAGQIVKYRQEKGLFKRRDELTQVPSFSSKAFEQSAGFLRVVNGEVPLDATGVHPERYSAVRDMAKELGQSISSLMGKGAEQLTQLKEKWSKLIGEFTFDDIVSELQKPGRDPRDPFKVFQFREDIFSVDDLKEGMVCNGIVSNVTNFGAFVDIGVHQDGLVHISEIANQFVNDPQKMLSPGDQVQVQIKAVDKEKNQISLTMKFGENASSPVKRAPRKPTDGNRERSKDGKRPAGKKFAKGKPTRKPQKSGGGGDRPRRPSQPFNNPFAALSDLKK
jgi:protein Tex